MHLIRVDGDELRLEELIGHNIPPYAILSHTWGREELEFTDFPLAHKNLERKLGADKVVKFCAEVLSRGIKYAWVDTCCIDKSSIIGLSEAINSMYKWYAKAEVCITYLSDHEVGVNRLRDSRWFKRGWTLQELIAPRHVDFYDKSWSFVDKKKNLKGSLSSITGIDEAVLGGANPLKYSVAQRMSWAAGRRTTRIEDVAYCLLGLFDVNLPLIYGLSDARNAFVALQEEIIKRSADHTIFAWHNFTSKSGRGHCGLLATSPDAFAGCSHVIQSSSSGLNAEGYGMTNVGLVIKLYTRPITMNTYIAILDCTRTTSPRSRYVLFVERLVDDNQYARVRWHGQTRRLKKKNQERVVARKICVQQHPGPALNQLWGFCTGPILTPVDGINPEYCSLPRQTDGLVYKIDELSKTVLTTQQFLHCPAIMLNPIARQIRGHTRVFVEGEIKRPESGLTNLFQVYKIRLSLDDEFLPQILFFVKETVMPTSKGRCHRLSICHYRDETLTRRPTVEGYFGPYPPPKVTDSTELIHGEPGIDSVLQQNEKVRIFVFKGGRTPMKTVLNLGHMAKVEVKLDLRPCLPPACKPTVEVGVSWMIWTFSLKVSEILYDLSHREEVELGVVKPCRNLRGVVQWVC